MNPSRVSIVIPAYNQADYLGAAIQSVLHQSFSDWELIIVDDGSTDSTALVAHEYEDSRIKYIYQKNRGLPGARNTGIHNSSGEYLAFLDADDTYLPQKLELQVRHLDEHAEIGLSYASRIEIDQQGGVLRLARAPLGISLRDLVLGFPFSINDLLLRREWIHRTGVFDESFYLHAEDRDFYVRLALDGCTFGGLEKFVACRRIHPGRVFRNLELQLSAMLRALNTVFDDARCPAEIASLKNVAYKEVLLSWIYQEYSQNEIRLAKEHLQEVIRLDASILADGMDGFLDFMFWSSIRDGGEHEEPLRTLLNNLPEEMKRLSTQADWAVGRGYLMRGVRDVIWSRMESAAPQFAEAASRKAILDRSLLVAVAEQLHAYEIAFGMDPAMEALERLTPFVLEFGGRSSLRWLNGCISINQAFHHAHAGDHSRVPSLVMHAVANNPSYLTNLGVYSIFLRSMTKRIR